MDPLLSASGLFSAYDLHFAGSSAASGAENHEFALAAALVSRATGNGDVWPGPHGLRGSEHGRIGGRAAMPVRGPLGRGPAGKPGRRPPGRAPAAWCWTTATASIFTVLEYESRLAAAIRDRAASPVEDLDKARLQAAIRRQFSGRQRPGDRLAAGGRGGGPAQTVCGDHRRPGTGKTTTSPGCSPSGTN